MMPARRTEPALVRGCYICADMKHGMLTLLSGVMLCRPCAQRIGRLLQTCEASIVSKLWACRSYEPGTKREVVTDPSMFTSHYDLGVAYAEMGLCVDAIRALAVSLDTRAPEELARNALYWIFQSDKARPDALDLAVDALRRTH